MLRERSDLTPLSVAELNETVRSVIEGSPVLNRVSVRGEISNFTNHSSGHLYFSVKDAEAQVRAVMFRSSAARLAFRPEEGMKVIVTGKVTVYPKTGSYQIVVSSMQPDGIGALYLAYEQMKSKLEAEGLFAPEHKLPIPKMPARIGVITSPTGAAIHDIIHITGRRFPLAEVYLYPALVQGEGAPADLIRALRYFEDSRLCDVVIIGRGGGSIEDLWAFNDERVARTIYAMTIPVISAVGHETDFTICDFVADLRAPTPSGAAELAVPDAEELLMTLDVLSDRLRAGLSTLADRKAQRLERLMARAPLSDPESVFSEAAQKLITLTETLDRAADSVLCVKERTVAILAGKADALSPLSVLSRGYAAIAGERGGVRHIADVRCGDSLTLTLADGTVGARVETITEKERE